MTARRTRQLAAQSFCKNSINNYYTGKKLTQKTQNTYILPPQQQYAKPAADKRT